MTAITDVELGALREYRLSVGKDIFAAQGIIRGLCQTKPLKAPKELWAVYCGDINSANVSKFVSGLVAVSNNGTQRVHILFQSWGGFVGDGVFLYNAFKKLSVEIIL